MLCPECEGDTTVKDSRTVISLGHVRRRRACETCSYKFTTYELTKEAINEKDLIIRTVEDIRQGLTFLGWRKPSDNNTQRSSELGQGHSSEIHNQDGGTNKSC